MPNQPPPNVSPEPVPRFRIPRVECVISNLGLSYSTVSRDPDTGVVTCSLGTVDQRVTLADDPGVLLALLNEAHAQVLEVGRASESE
jgi:hypothetical protein